MGMTDQIKQELFNRGYSSAEADALASAYTRMMTNEQLDEILTDEEVEMAADQIENMD